MKGKRIDLKKCVQVPAFRHGDLFAFRKGERGLFWTLVRTNDDDPRGWTFVAQGYGLDALREAITNADRPKPKPAVVLGADGKPKP